MSLFAKWRTLTVVSMAAFMLLAEPVPAPAG
jgi:hypothetical protein